MNESLVRAPRKGLARVHPIIPLTGSDVAGPLGLARLPRLWLETLLAVSGRLPPGFARDDHAFDAIIAHEVGLDLGAMYAALEHRPSYPAFERWVRAHARQLDEQSIARANAAIRNARVDGTPIVLADALATWSALHAQVAGNRGRLPIIVPAVSARTHGRLSIDHLARLWAKMLLEAVDALPEGYRAGPVRVVAGRERIQVVGGLDLPLLERFGIDAPGLVAFVAATQPTYDAFEGWVRTHGRLLDPERIATHNATRYDARPEKAALERAEVGLEDSNLVWSYVLNDLGDWKALHDQITA